MFLAAGQQFLRPTAATSAVETVPCIPNTITDINLATSIAKVKDYLVRKTPSREQYQFRTNAVTNGVSAYGYAYCYYSEDHCKSCLEELVGYLKVNCQNATDADVASMYCYMKYGPYPV
ncbi:hypothetical protein LINPERPRIM_LOCUS39963 [Linum perenne]